MIESVELAVCLAIGLSTFWLSDIWLALAIGYLAGCANNTINVTPPNSPGEHPLNCFVNLKQKNFKQYETRNMNSPKGHRLSCDSPGEHPFGFVKEEIAKHRCEQHEKV